MGHVQQVVFIRRPSPLLKSPSVDSESSTDPLTLPTSSSSCAAGAVTGGPNLGSVGGGGGPHSQKKTGQTHVLRKIHEKGALLLAHRYTYSKQMSNQLLIY